MVLGPIWAILRMDCNTPWIHVDSWRVRNYEVVWRAVADLGKGGAEWVGVSRLKVRIFRAEKERKLGWCGCWWGRGKKKEGKKETFREKKSFWEILGGDSVGRERKAWRKNLGVSEGLAPREKEKKGERKKKKKKQRFERRNGKGF